MPFAFSIHPALMGQRKPWRAVLMVVALCWPLAQQALAQLTPEIVEAKKRRDAEAEVKRLKKELEALKKAQPAAGAPPAAAPQKPAVPGPAALDPRVTFRTMESAMQQRDCELCGQMAVIPAGSFVIGSPKTEKGRNKDENSPARPIRISAFEMGRSEVTRAQWRAVMGTNPVDNTGCDACPVTEFRWNDITGTDGFLARLNKLTGQNYRLPSEAEWEYATRAGSSTAYWWGNAFDTLRATDGKNHNGGVPPSQGVINPFGLAHTSGNVTEYVQDCYTDSYAQLPSDGRALDSVNECLRRVTRGGASPAFPGQLRSAERGATDPNPRYYDVGFRLARNL